MQIDELTGLPELPDGCFWRVLEYSNPYFALREPSSYGFYVEIVEKTTLIKPAVKSFWFFEWHSGTYEEVKEKTLVSEQIKKHTTDGKTEVLLEDLSKDLILKAAERAYDRWHLMERGQKLLGDYPPKSLKVVDNDEGK